MKKKIYSTPKAELLWLAPEDVIKTSDGDLPPLDGPWTPFY